MLICCGSVKNHSASNIISQFAGNNAQIRLIWDSATNIQLCNTKTCGAHENKTCLQDSKQNYFSALNIILNRRINYLESLSALARTAFLTAKSRIKENNWWDWQWSPLMPQTNRTVETDWPIQCNIIQCRQVMGSSLVFSLPDLIVMTRREKFSPRLSLYPSKPQGWIVFPWGGDAGVPSVILEFFS